MVVVVVVVGMLVLAVLVVMEREEIFDLVYFYLWEERWRSFSLIFRLRFRICPLSPPNYNSVIWISLTLLLE